MNPLLLLNQVSSTSQNNLFKGPLNNVDAEVRENENDLSFSLLLTPQLPSFTEQSDFVNLQASDQDNNDPLLQSMLYDLQSLLARIVSPIAEINTGELKAFDNHDLDLSGKLQNLIKSSVNNLGALQEIQTINSLPTSLQFLNLNRDLMSLSNTLIDGISNQQLNNSLIRLNPKQGAEHNITHYFQKNDTSTSLDLFNMSNKNDLLNTLVKQLNEYAQAPEKKTFLNTDKSESETVKQNIYLNSTMFDIPLGRKKNLSHHVPPLQADTKNPKNDSVQQIDFLSNVTEQLLWRSKDKVLVDIPETSMRVGNQNPTLLTTNSIVNIATSEMMTHPNSTSGSVNTQSTTLNTPYNLNDSGWEHGFSKQIAYFLRNGIHNAELRLSPAELGTLSISIKINEHNVAQLNIISQNQQVRALFEASVDTLKQSLADSGISLSNSFVGSENPQNSKDNKHHHSQSSFTSDNHSQEQNISEPEILSNNTLTVRNSGIDEFI